MNEKSRKTENTETGNAKTSKALHQKVGKLIKEFTKKVQSEAEKEGVSVDVIVQVREQSKQSKI